MSEWLMQSNYMIMILQVLVTLVIVPILSSVKLKNIANQYGLVRYPQAKSDVEQYLKISQKRYWSSVVMVTLLVSFMLGHAIVNQTELLNWDDQSGLMVMYLLSMVPVVIMLLTHRHLFNIFKQHAGNKRTASLRVRTLKEYVSIPDLVLVVIANAVFVVTVMYFVKHPFDGFAGYANLFGLIVLNAVFAIIIVILYRDNKTYGLASPEHRDALKKRAIHINMLILVFAVCHISLSMWVQGTELVAFKIIIQSLYFQVMLAATAFSLTLPKSVFQQITAKD
jgi:hypothetical protein